MIKNPRQFPIHTILDHKQQQFIDPKGIKTKKHHTYAYGLCQIITHITNGETKDIYSLIVMPILVITTPNYLPNTIRKDNINTSQTLSMPTSPQNNKEIQDTLPLPQ
jgi:hypothetical protein